MGLMRLGAILFLTGFPSRRRACHGARPPECHRLADLRRRQVRPPPRGVAVAVVAGVRHGNRPDDTPGRASDSHAELSGNGQFVAYKTDLGVQIYVLDRNTGIIEVVSKSSSGVVGNHTSYDPSLSDDGRYVSFRSYASNLVVGDTNGVSDVFVHDRLTQVTTRVNINGGYQTVAESGETRISGNGEWVYFLTGDLLLAGGRLVLHHLPTGLTTCPVAGTTFTDPYRDPRISRYGQHVAYGDTFGRAYRRDLWNGITTPISVLPNGTHVTGSSHGELSPDGGFFLFQAMINLPRARSCASFSATSTPASRTSSTSTRRASSETTSAGLRPIGGPPACNGIFWRRFRLRTPRDVHQLEPVARSGRRNHANPNFSSATSRRISARLRRPRWERRRHSR